MSPRVNGPLSKRLAAHSIDAESGCRLWQGHCTYKGYGQIRYEGAAIGAHVAAWIAAHGPVPTGLVVCHKCDVRNCIAIDHLFLGTPAENTADMLAKDRARKDTWFKSIFSDRDLRVIGLLRHIGVYQKDIAAMYNVKQSCISRVLKRIDKEVGNVVD